MVRAMATSTAAQALEDTHSASTAVREAPQQHFPPSAAVGVAAAGPTKLISLLGGPLDRVAVGTRIAISRNSSSTFAAVLADVSAYNSFSCRAYSAASSESTCRLLSRSDLLPASATTMLVSTIFFRSSFTCRQQTTPNQTYVERPWSAKAKARVALRRCSARSTPRANHGGSGNTVELTHSLAPSYESLLVRSKTTKAAWLPR